MRRALALVVILLLSEISTQATDRQEQVVAALGTRKTAIAKS